jgi:N,N'-diacetyllegionaminate synthase
MRISGFDLNERVLVIAEIGNNHEGDVEAAKEMVRAAARAGADAVKFQTFVAERFVRASDDQARFDRLKKFELSPAAFAELAALARSEGLLFISTPLDLASVSILEPLVDAFKIASSDNTFFPLLTHVARTGKPMLVSTGLADIKLVREAVRFVQNEWSDAGVTGDLAVLHCVTSYPVEPAQANLRSIEALEQVGVVVGYSDHTVGLDAAPVAVALGARIVEKHFTLDHDYSDFRDHKLSADPEELAELVRRVRQASALLGTQGKAVQAAEEPFVVTLRRSIVAAAPLEAGHRLEEADLMWTRPGGGLAPGEEHRVVGRRLVRDVAFGEPIAASDVD